MKSSNTRIRNLKDYVPVFRNGEYYPPTDLIEKEESSLTMAFIKWKASTVFSSKPKPPTDFDEIFKAQQPVLVTEKSKEENEKLKRLKGRINATWIGHSTYLLQVEYIKDEKYHLVNIITDPIFGDRCYEYNVPGVPKRIRPAALKIESLPKIDYILISHAHYDHLQMYSCESIIKKDDPIILVPRSASCLFENKTSPKRVKELTWNEKIEFDDNVSFTFVPAKHWGNRSGMSNKYLWGGWIMNINDLIIYFVGDTAYDGTLFKMIGDSFPIDLSLIPIGAYLPREVMKRNHICPEEAAKICRDTKTKNALAMHWATFILSDEQILQPKDDLEKALKEMKIKNFKTVTHGTTTVYDCEKKEK